MINKFYTGCVEGRDDPLKLGRCQVRIVGLHTEDKTILPTKDLPWAYPVSPITSAGVSGIGSTPIGPVEGSWVLIMFMDPDEQLPIMMGTLNGVAQIENSTDDPGKLKIQNTDPDGTVNPSAGDNTSGNKTTTPEKLKDGKVIDNPNEIVGPLANLIAKGESGSAGYDAFNRGSNAPKGSGSIGGEKLTLTDMTIKDVMEKQALPPGSPDKLFAVGKYQCIPITLKAACQALNIDTQQKFTQQTQDIICQEYLVARKRPKLVAYYKNPNKNDDTFLKDAGQTLAAEFASIEDPYYPGFPYGGPNGTYAKAGNKVHTKWDTIKPTLIKEWEFRNNPKQPSPTTAIADGDKVEKGSDYTGVRKYLPADDSTTTTAEPSVSGGGNVPNDLPNPDNLGGLADIAGAGDLTNLANIPGLGDVAGSLSSFGDLNNLNLNNIGELGNLSSVVGELGISGLGNLDASLLSGITSIQTQFADLTKSINLDGEIGSLLKSVTGNATSVLTQFGGSLTEITQNLGIENPTGSLSGLAANLGLPLSSLNSGALVKELEKIAGSDVGQARAMMAKLQGEPTRPQPVPVGEKRPDGTISNGTDVDPTKGFQDPNGKYPAYKNEPDTNRLAYGNNLGRTIVVEKEATRKTGVRIANGGTWDQSQVPYNAVYPYNKVTQTESGHILEYDDSPGAERINVHHKAGTFNEIDANGTQVNRIVGDGFEIMERNGYVYVKGAYNVTVDGAFNLRTDNVFNLEVSGAANINIFNNATVNVSGNADMAIGGTFNLRANKINMQSEGQFNIKAKTGLNLMAGADMNVYTEGSLIAEADGNISNKTKGAVFIESGTDTNIKSAALVNIQSEDKTNIKSGDALNLDGVGNLNLKSGAIASLSGDSSIDINSGGTVAVDGSSIQLNDGTSSAAGEAGEAKEAKPAKHAGQADIELPIETRGTSGVSQLPPLPLSTRKSEVGFENQEPTNDLNAYRANRVQNNELSKSEVQSNTLAQGTEKPQGSSSPSGVASDVSGILNMSPDAFNAGMRLSKNFTLGDLTKGGTRIPRRSYNVPTKRGGALDRSYAPQDIVANLKRLCDNVLEPIAEKYGRDSFIITSAYRRASTGPTDPGDLGLKNKDGSYDVEWGDHVAGCACDISFKDGKAATHARAAEISKLLKSWNQIIMEYDNGGKSFWIHCAYKAQGNAGHTFSMNSHVVIPGTFPNGGFVLV
jgi:hypothetical protein